MATAGTVTDESETLNCPVCITKFDNPRILPCLHTICEKCLRANMESQGQNSTQFMCPICETPAVPSDADLAIDKRIDGFIPDNTIKSLMDTAENADNKDDRCDPCKRENENTIAEIWCLVCKEKLCGPCVKYHKRYNVSVQHTMVPVSEYMEKTTCDINFERTCARHPRKPLDLFCVDHRELCCVLCFASNHCECNNIRGVDDFVKDQAKGFSYNKFLEDLMKMKTAMNKVITDKNDNVVQLAQEKEKIINDMCAIVDRIIAKLNELRKSFRDEAEHLHEDGKLSILKYHKEVQRFLTNLNNSYRVLVNVIDDGSPSQKFVMLATVRSQIISHQQQLKNDINDDAEVHLTLKPNKVLQDIEKSLESLGVVEVTQKTNTVMEDSLNNIDDNIKDLNSRTQLSIQMCAAQVEKSDTMTSSVTLVKSVKQQKFGKGTDISGGAFLRNGRLVVADCNNSRLLLLGDDYNIVREYIIQGEPRDIAAGHDQNEIYISIYIYPNTCIYRCTLDTHLTIKQRITAPYGICGISVSGDTIIAATAAAVLLLSQDGSTVKLLPTSFDTYRYVAGSRTPPLIYHGDGRSVVSRTFIGETLFRYKNDKLKTVRGICLHKNNVYVCGADSHNVHQISCDGQRSRILLDKLHSISQPWIVLINGKKNEIIITSKNEDTVMEVYKWN